MGTASYLHVSAETETLKHNLCMLPLHVLVGFCLKDSQSICLPAQTCLLWQFQAPFAFSWNNSSHKCCFRCFPCSLFLVPMTLGIFHLCYFSHFALCLSRVGLSYKRDLTIFPRSLAQSLGLYTAWLNHSMHSFCSVVRA